MAKCDNCSQVTKIKFKEVRHQQGIKETYFNCEHCKTRYICFLTDERVREMQQKLRSFGGRHNGRMKLQQEINERMNLLKYNLINFGRADL